MARYFVSPIGDADCDTLSSIVIINTDDLATAQWHASHNSCVFGAGILDIETGKLDVGYGFGVACPDPNEG
jgi:hypothetical protein